MVGVVVSIPNIWEALYPLPDDPSKKFIKRCIASGGQHVEIREKVVYIDGVEQEPPEHVKFVDPYIYPASV